MTPRECEKINDFHGFMEFTHFEAWINKQTVDGAAVEVSVAELSLGEKLA